MGLVRHHLQLCVSEEMATIITDGSTARTNGYVAYHYCRCVTVQEGLH